MLEVIAGVATGFADQRCLMDEASALVCWIGHTDLWAMAKERRELSEEVQRLTGQNEPRKYPGLGPIKTLTSQRPFDRVDLISNYPEPINEAFARWLGASPVVHRRALKDPTDYEEVFRVTSDVLEKISAENKRVGRRLAIHLSPGTPTMTAILILLGKTRHPATLFQTHGGNVIETRIPFDLELSLSRNCWRSRTASSTAYRSRGQARFEASRTSWVRVPSSRLPSRREAGGDPALQRAPRRRERNREGALRPCYPRGEPEAGRSARAGELRALPEKLLESDSLAM